MVLRDFGHEMRLRQLISSRLNEPPVHETYFDHRSHRALFYQLEDSKRHDPTSDQSSPFAILTYTFDTPSWQHPQDSLYSPLLLLNSLFRYAIEVECSVGLDC